MPFEKTEQFTLTLGVTPGYFHKTEEGPGDKLLLLNRLMRLNLSKDVLSALRKVPKENLALRQVVETAMQFGEELFQEMGLFPSFVATPGLAGYREEWGCPPGGEFVVTLSAQRNPKFEADPVLYERAWIKLAELLKEKFQQTTIRLVRQEVDLLYMTSK